jgi:hypothetical protein
MLHGDGNFVGIFRLGVTPFGRSGGAQDDRFKGHGRTSELSLFLEQYRYFLSNVAIS